MAFGPGAAAGPSSPKSGTDSEVVLGRCSAATCVDRLLDAHIRSLLTRTLVLDRPRWSAARSDIVSSQFNSLNQRKE